MYKTRECYINSLPDNIVGVELGVFEGSFSKILFDSNKFHSLYLVDIFSGSMFSGDKNGENGKNIDLDTAFRELQKVYENIPNVYIIKNTTTAFLNTCEDEFFDFVYIDADHTFQAVSDDLHLSRLKVKKGGIIAGHDYNIARFPGVVDAVDNFVKTFDLEIEFTTEDKLASYFIKNK